MLNSHTWSAATVLGSRMYGTFLSRQQVLSGTGDPEVSAWSGTCLSLCLYLLCLLFSSYPLSSSNNWPLAVLGHSTLVLPQAFPFAIPSTWSIVPPDNSRLTSDLCSRHVLGEGWSKYHPYHSLCPHSTLFFFSTFVTTLCNLVFCFVLFFCLPQ